jgi:tRNA-Thr(GGU) m(6)t(6)A37 methyltransferase TsaA
MEMQIRAVGVIHTSHVTKEETPIQGAFQPDAMGMVELFPEFAAGLLDISLFSHIILIYHFDRAGQVEMIRKPFLDDAPHGIFATRHPCRPNHLGISIVRLQGHEGNLLKVSGIGVLDGTPLIDVKPYVPRFDCWPEASEGWFAGKEKREKPPGRE